MDRREKRLNEILSGLKTAPMLRDETNRQLQDLWGCGHETIRRVFYMYDTGATAAEAISKYSQKADKQKEYQRNNKKQVADSEHMHRPFGRNYLSMPW